MFTSIFHFLMNLLIPLSFFWALCWKLSHFGQEICCLLYKNLKWFLRKVILSNWYPNIDYKLIREHVRLRINISWNLAAAKRLWGSVEKYVHSKAAVFQPTDSPYLVLWKNKYWTYQKCYWSVWLVKSPL